MLKARAAEVRIGGTSFNLSPFRRKLHLRILKNRESNHCFCFRPRKRRGPLSVTEEDLASEEVLPHGARLALDPVCASLYKNTLSEMIQTRSGSRSVGRMCQKTWNFQRNSSYIMQCDTPAYILVYSENTHSSAFIACFFSSWDSVKSHSEGGRFHGCFLFSRFCLCTCSLIFLNFSRISEHGVETWEYIYK